MFGMFSPKQLLGLLADEIEKQRNHSIEKYVMIYAQSSNTVLFQLNDSEEKLPLDNPALADGIKMLVGEKVPDGWTLEYAFIFWDKSKECSIGLHTINNATGEKHNEKLTL